MPTRRSLTLHRDSQCKAVSLIDVEVSRRYGLLLLDYRVTGRTQDLCLPSVVPPGRAEQLWKHTCFEVFVREPGAEVYAEFNFSPSKEWAAYRFASRRRGMTNVTEVPAPQIKAEQGESHLTLGVSLYLEGIPHLWAERSWQLALSAVIEETDGHLSYWAMTHAPDRPDFHHPDGFTLALSAMEQS